MNKSLKKSTRTNLAMLALSFLFAGCGELAALHEQQLPSAAIILSGGRPKGDLKGYIALSRQLTQSLVSETAGLRDSEILDRHLPALIDSQEASLLLGGFITAGNGSTSYVNGTPNAVSVFLWSTLLWSLATELSEICSKDTQNPPYRPEFVADLKSYCTDPGPSSFSSLWFWIVGFVAEEERLEVLRSMAQGEGNLPLADALYLMLMNPYLLLEV